MVIQFWSLVSPPRLSLPTVVLGQRAVALQPGQEGSAPHMHTSVRRSSSSSVTSMGPESVLSDRVWDTSSGCSSQGHCTTPVDSGPESSGSQRGVPPPARAHLDKDHFLASLLHTVQQQGECLTFLLQRLQQQEGCPPSFQQILAEKDRRLRDLEDRLRVVEERSQVAETERDQLLASQISQTAVLQERCRSAEAEIDMLRTSLAAQEEARVHSDAQGEAQLQHCFAYIGQQQAAIEKMQKEISRLSSQQPLGLIQKLIALQEQMAANDVRRQALWQSQKAAAEQGQTVNQESDNSHSGLTAPERSECPAHREEPPVSPASASFCPPRVRYVLASDSSSEESVSSSSASSRTSRRKRNRRHSPGHASSASQQDEHVQWERGCTPPVHAGVLCFNCKGRGHFRRQCPHSTRYRWKPAPSSSPGGR